MNLGKAIKSARGSMYTQYDIATLTGVTNVYISLLEGNKRECSMSWLKKFSLLVGIPIPVLFYMAMDEEDTSSYASDDFNSIKSEMDKYMNSCFGVNV